MSRLLLIDDEDDIREIARMSLATVGGHEVVTAVSGADAVRAGAAAAPLDAIVLDVMMPGLDGPSTLERLREHDWARDVPVIFLTAKVQPADRRALEALGAAGIVAKPFDPMALAGEIEAILEAAR
jgi:CheY-like chemotaxis protein